MQGCSQCRTCAHIAVGVSPASLYRATTNHAQSQCISGATRVQVNPPRLLHLRIAKTSIGVPMPTKKATNSRTRKKRVVDHVARLLCPKCDPTPLSLATYDRIDELAKPTLTELDCRICEGV